MRPVLYALAAILIWSTLALAGAGLTEVPPFLLLGVAFTTGGLAGLVRLRDWRVPPLTLLVGVGGIFGYHFLFFRAFTLAPAVEANLVNYLWPLLIVVLSPVVLRGYALSLRHFLGAALGLAGAALIATGGRFEPDTRYLPGYLLAGGAAVVWALYSLLTKRLPRFPTGAVGLFCLLSGLLSFAAFGLGGGTLAGLSALSAGQWLALVLAGLGPMGAAFYFWDAALKGGDPRVIGALAYLTPLLSTLNLVLLGGQALSPLAVLAMALIVGGALVGSRQ